MTRRALAIGITLLAIAACSAPRIVEDSAAECANGVDDDGDGRVDCDDPKCVAAGRCESSADACANGLDDDDNGAVDCEDRTCVAAGHCEPRDATCSVDPPSGCVTGLVCSASEGETAGSRCALPGSVPLHRPCDGQGSCAAGLHCIGFCRKICQDEGDCPRETFCVRNGRTKFGYCSTPCIPALMGSGCTLGTCVSLSSFELAFDLLDAGATCADPVPWKPTAKEGDECDAPSSIAKLDRMCEPHLVCFPSPSGVPRCRSTCAISQEGDVIVACAAGRKCGRAYPLDARPALEGQLLLGICEP